jgi:hypothetical protein
LTPIALKIQGLGHVPSFKNSKMIARGKLITDPKKQAWMEQCISLMAAQLSSSCPMSETGTLTAQSLRSWIATSLPLDDSCKWIESISVIWLNVPKGKEGAQIMIAPSEIAPSTLESTGQDPAPDEIEMPDIL